MKPVTINHRVLLFGGAAKAQLFHSEFKTPEEALEFCRKLLQSRPAGEFSAHVLMETRTMQATHKVTRPEGELVVEDLVST